MNNLEKEIAQNRKIQSSLGNSGSYSENYPFSITREDNILTIKLHTQGQHFHLVKLIKLGCEYSRSQFDSIVNAQIAEYDAFMKLPESVRNQAFENRVNR